MPENESIACQFFREVDNARRQSSEKTRLYPKLSAPYGQVALELRRIIHRHTQGCSTCMAAIAKQSGVPA